MDLKEYLYQKRLTLKQFSEIIGYNRSYLSLIMNGKLKPSKRLAKDIQEATNGQVTENELLEEQK